VGQWLPTKHTRGHATLTGGQLCAVTGIYRICTDGATFQASSTRAAANATDAVATTAAAGSRSGRGAAGECVSIVFTLQTIIANPPLGWTSGPQSRLRRSNSFSRLCGARGSSQSRLRRSNSLSHSYGGPAGPGSLDSQLPNLDYQVSYSDAEPTVWGEGALRE